LSQAQRLAAAELTAQENVAALEKMLRLEEDKKKPTAKRYTSVLNPPTLLNSIFLIVSFRIQQPKISMISSPNGLVVGYENAMDVPIYKPMDPVQKHLKCALTGQNATYRDPMTGKGYCSIEHFKQIRRYNKSLF
jgi:hypothetical protein